MSFSDKLNIAVLIINSIAAVAAVVAAIIAIFGNRQSQEQFKTSMRAQERAINLSLFDERVKVLENIKEGKFTFSRERASLLFNFDIDALINHIDELNREREEYTRLLKRFIECMVIKSHGDDEPDIAEDILNAHKELQKLQSMQEYSQQRYDALYAFLDKHKECFPEENFPLAQAEHSLADIDSLIQDALIEAIEKFIRVSIS